MLLPLLAVHSCTAPPPTNRRGCSATPWISAATFTNSATRTSCGPSGGVRPSEGEGSVLWRRNELVRASLSTTWNRSSDLSAASPFPRGIRRRSGAAVLDSVCLAATVRIRMKTGVQARPDTPSLCWWRSAARQFMRYEKIPGGHRYTSVRFDAKHPNIRGRNRVR